MLRSPEQWRIARIGAVRNEWVHACAAAVHGWARHVQMTGHPMQLSAADYGAALRKVVHGRFHAGAMSPYAKGDDT